MKKTILYDQHIALKAKMAPFGGFDMPIQYEGIIKEHLATRREATIFDTCHMGEFRVSGPDALADLERIISSDVGSLKPGRCRNGFFCNENGGVVDDLIVYRFGDREFMIVVNAGTQDGDYEWLRSHLSKNTQSVNISAETAKIDLQGPGAPKIFAQLARGPISDFAAYQHRSFEILGEKMLVSRTGYTGEIGFEIYCSSARAADVWQECMKLGAKPAGLGARDTLRLEMCFPLYGHELNDQRNVAESGFEKLISTTKEFIGSAAVRDPSRSPSRLSAILLEGRRSARSGDVICDPAGTEIGKVTSGSYSPSLERAIAMGYVRKESSSPGTSVRIKAERLELSGTIVDKPFYKGGTSRRILDEFLK